MKNKQFFSPTRILYNKSFFLYTRRFFNKEEIEKGAKKYIEENKINNPNGIELNNINDSIYKSKKYHFFVPKRNKIILGGKQFYPDYLFGKTEVDKLNKLNNIYLNYKNHFGNKHFNKDELYDLFLKAGISTTIKKIEFLFGLTDNKTTITFKEILNYSLDSFFQHKYKLFRYNIKNKLPDCAIPLEFPDLIIKFCEEEIDILNKKQEEKKLKENSQNIINNIRVNLYSEDTIRKKIFREFSNSNSSYSVFHKYNKNSNVPNKQNLSNTKSLFSNIRNENNCNIKKNVSKNTRNSSQNLSLSSQKNLKYKTEKISEQLFLGNSPAKIVNTVKKASHSNFHIFDMNMNEFDDEIIDNPSTKSYKIFPNGQSNYKEILDYHENSIKNTKTKMKNLFKELKDIDTVGKKNLKSLKLVKSLETIYNYNPLLKKNYIFFDSIQQKFKKIEKNLSDEIETKKEKINYLFVDYEKNKVKKKIFDKLAKNFSFEHPKNVNSDLKNERKNISNKSNTRKNNFVNSINLNKYNINTIREHQKKYHLNKNSRKNNENNNIYFTP